MNQAGMSAGIAAPLCCAPALHLAVDFTTFPRQYAKSRTYGTSALCFLKFHDPLLCCTTSQSAHWRCPRHRRDGHRRWLRNLCQCAGGKAGQARSWRSCKCQPMLRALPGCSPACFGHVSAATRTMFTALTWTGRQVGKCCHAACAGGARAFATWASGYEVDATEYGEHWNFYLTLGAVSLLNAFARIPPRFLLPVGRLPSPSSRAAPVTQGLRPWVGKLVS